MFKLNSNFNYDLLLCQIEYFVLLCFIEFKDIGIYSYKIKIVRDISTSVLFVWIIYLMSDFILYCVVKCFNKSITIKIIFQKTIIFLFFMQVIVAGVIAIGLRMT